LTRAQFDTLDADTVVHSIPVGDGDRFWHMKAYWIQHGDKVFTAVGSCNFTEAGLAGKDGNVEAMLVFQANPDWLLDGEEIDPDDLATEEEAEEQAPVPTPVSIVVAWDWRALRWRYWLEAGAGQSDFRLRLPGIAAFDIQGGTHARVGKPPPRGSTYTVSYTTRGSPKQWEGQIVEVNLDHSSRTYGRPLTANQILESWRGSSPGWDLGGGGGGAGDPEDGEDSEQGVEAAFDAVNLYDFYRAMKALRAKLGSYQKQPSLQRAHLVGRPNSVVALAHLANGDGEAPVVRYLVLRELGSVIELFADVLDSSLVQRVQEMVQEARGRTSVLLEGEAGVHDGQGPEMLRWFEEQLSALDRGLPE